MKGQGKIKMHILPVGKLVKTILSPSAWVGRPLFVMYCKSVAFLSPSYNSRSLFSCMKEYNKTVLYMQIQDKL